MMFGAQYRRPSALLLLAVSLAACRFTFDRSIPRGALHGRVVFDSTTSTPHLPASGAHVVIPGTSLDVTTGANGAFTIPNLPAATYTLDITSHKGTKAGVHLTGIVLAPGDGRDLGEVAVGALGAVSGTVIDHGAPVDGATVVLHGTARVLTVAGAYTLNDILPGKYDLSVLIPGPEGSGRVVGPISVVVSARSTVHVAPIDVAEARTVSAGSVSGQVLRQGTESSQGILIQLGTTGLQAQTSDAAGHYVLSTAPVGVHDIIASAPGYAPAAARNVVVVGDTTVPLMLLQPAPDRSEPTPSSACAHLAACGALGGQTQPQCEDNLSSTAVGLATDGRCSTSARLLEELSHCYASSACAELTSETGVCAVIRTVLASRVRSEGSICTCTAEPVLGTIQECQPEIVDHGCVLSDVCGEDDRCDIPSGACVPTVCIPGDNNSLPNAKPIAAGETIASEICNSGSGSDQLYFRTDLLSGDGIDLHLVASAYGYWDIAVLDSSGSVIAQGQRRIQTVTNLTGTHYFRVMSTVINGPFNLRVDVTHGAPCFPDADAPNGLNWQAIPLGNGIRYGRRVCPGEQKWYSVAAQAGAPTRVTVQSDDPLRVCSYGNNGTSLIDCDTNIDVSFSTESATYFRVDAPDGATRSSYDIEVVGAPASTGSIPGDEPTPPPGNIYVASPRPPQGTTHGGTRVTLAGLNVTPGTTPHVVFGGWEATGVSIAGDGKTLEALTPPGPPGSTDISVLSAAGASTLRRGWVYVEPPAVTSMNVVTSPLSGGSITTVSGRGFSPDAQVRFGNVPAVTTYISSTQLQVTIPPGADVGAVTVTVEAQGGSASFHGFAYAEPSSELQLFSLGRSQGPVEGGACASGRCIPLVGTGFSVAPLNVLVGGTPATVDSIIGDTLAMVDMPPGDPGLVDVEVSSTAGIAVLPQSFGYVVPLSLSNYGLGEVLGEGLSASCSVFINGLEATVLSVTPDGTSLSILPPPQIAGPEEIRVSCEAPGSLLYQEASLPGSMSISAAPPELFAVDEGSGSVAGNTNVVIKGRGFWPGLSVLFNGVPGSQVQVQSDFIARVRTPPGTVGPAHVTVRTESGETTADLFSYFDPVQPGGGVGGGPMRGVLNVTVLDAQNGQPLSNALVSIGADRLLGATDAHGHVTFSDPALWVPVSISAIKDGYSSVTLYDSNARNVTLTLDPPAQDKPKETPMFATFRGKACGFGTLPAEATATGGMPQARVYASVPTLAQAPPFAAPATPVIVNNDCGTFTLTTSIMGPTTVYAMLGVVETGGEFTPYRLEILRGLNARAGAATNTPALSFPIPLDVSVPIRVETSTSSPRTDTTYSYLDLGTSFIPLGSTIGTEGIFFLAHQPSVRGLVVLNRSSAYTVPDGGTSLDWESFCYARASGDPAAGISIGWMPALTYLDLPEGLSSLGQLLPSLANEAGEPADRLLVTVTDDAVPDHPVRWTAIAPSTGADQFTVPPSVESLFVHDTVQVSVEAATIPEYRANDYGFELLDVSHWSCFGRSAHPVSVALQR